MADHKKSPNAPTKTSTTRVTIPKPKGNPHVPKGRTYLFELPYDIAGFKASIGAGELKEAGLWDQIPPDLQQRLDAEGMFTGPLHVTKQDLDRIPTPAWAKIAAMLNLQWKA
jgi:hypothetical protein